jgi:hypothetical protein
LLSQHIRFEQATIRGEQHSELLSLGPADGLPPPERQPAFASAARASRARPKEFLPPDVVERGARTLQHVEFVEHDLRSREHGRNGIEIRTMHVGAHGGDRAALTAREVLGQQRRHGRFAPIVAQSHHFAVHDIGQHRPESLSDSGWSVASAIALPRPGRRANRPPHLRSAQAAGY